MAQMDQAQKRARAGHLLSYLAIGLLPILVCGMLLNYATYTRRTEQRDSDVQSGFALFSRTYAQLLSSMDACESHLEDNLSELLAESNEGGLSAQLLRYQRSYSLFGDVYFYRKGESSIYTTQGHIPYAAFEEQMRTEQGVDLNRTLFLRTLNETLLNTAFSSRGNVHESNDGKTLFYVRTVPALSARPEAVMVFSVSTEQLLGLLTQCVPEDYALYSYANEYLYGLYTSAESRQIALQEAVGRIGATAMQRVQVGNAQYLLLREKSEPDAMQHMLAYRCDVLYSAQRRDFAQTSLWLCALLLPVAVAAFSLHRRTYQPIATLLSLPLPKEEAVPAKANVETLLSSVAKGAGQVLTRNEELLEETEDLSARLRAQTVAALISGDAEEGISPETLWTQEPGFAYPVYTMFYVVASALPEDLFAEVAMEEMALPGARLFLLPLRENGRLAILCNHAECDRSALCDRVLSALQGRGIQPLQTGVGLPQRQKQRLRVSLAQAQAMLPLCTQPDTPALYSREEQGIGSGLSFTDTLLLRQCIRNGSRDLALSTLRKMHAEISLLSWDRSLTRAWSYFLYDAVQSVLVELRLSSLLDSLTAEEPFSLPADAFVAKMETVVCEACDAVGKREQTRYTTRQEELFTFVAEHFRDSDLSLLTLSSRFALSESYITGLFRQKLGESFLQHVSGLRMEWVRAQLRGSDRLIKEIIAEAGYVDIANFTRKFRQAYGMTPGQYRESCREDGKAQENAETI